MPIVAAIDSRRDAATESKGQYLVFVHLVGVMRRLEILIIILVIIILRRMLFGGLGEINLAASGAATDHVIQVNLLHVVLVFLLGCSMSASRDSSIGLVPQVMEVVRYYSRASAS
jgi:hypothetical protein